MENENTQTSEKNEENTEETVDQKTTNEEQTSEKKEQEEETSETKEDKKEEIPDYRPKPEKKEEKKNVPLAKYVAKKKELKEAQKRIKELESGSNKTKESPDDLDDKIDSKVKEAVSPLLREKQQAENIKNFEKDFEKSIASKYPDLKDKKDQFMEIAFNPNLVDKYPTLDSIRKAYFASSPKKTNVEGGSKGTSKGTEKIDFAKASDDPELYKKVMGDPELKKKYFAYLDSQGL